MAGSHPKATPGRSVEEHDRLAVLGLKQAAKDFAQMVALRVATEESVDELTAELEQLSKEAKKTTARLRKGAS